MENRAREREKKKKRKAQKSYRVNFTVQQANLTDSYFFPFWDKFPE